MNIYLDRYYKLINHYKQLTLEGYVEKHHIIPRTLGGKNDKANIVVLTAREHFVCHLLLTKMLTDGNRHKMVYALHMLSNIKNIGSGRYTPTSRSYDYSKKLFIE